MKKLWAAKVDILQIGRSSKNFPSCARRTKCPQPVTLLFAVAIAFYLSCVLSVQAAPRNPTPPFPELAPLLLHVSFDDPYWLGSNAPSVAVPYGTLTQSWSGYSLQRSGSLDPFSISGVMPAAHTNVPSGSSGALRFWVAPYFSFGTGPAWDARLAEVAAVAGDQAVAVWWLDVCSDGSILSLKAQTDSGSTELLQAGLAWQACEPHLLCLNWDSQATTLFLDGLLVAQGGPLPVVPPPAAVLTLGSSFSGAQTAAADLDEIFPSLALCWRAK